MHERFIVFLLIWQNLSSNSTMIVNEDAERMKQLLTEAITVLCKSGFNFTSEFSVEGLLGITFDKKDIVLLNINETFKIASGTYRGIISNPIGGCFL